MARHSFDTHARQAQVQEGAAAVRGWFDWLAEDNATIRGLLDALRRRDVRRRRPVDWIAAYRTVRAARAVGLFQAQGNDARRVTRTRLDSRIKRVKQALGALERAAKNFHDQYDNVDLDLEHVLGIGLDDQARARAVAALVEVVDAFKFYPVLAAPRRAKGRPKTGAIADQFISDLNRRAKIPGDIGRPLIRQVIGDARQGRPRRQVPIDRRAIESRALEYRQKT